MDDNYRNLPLLLLQAREKYMINFRPILNEHDITEQQWRIIRALAEHQSLEQRELCEICAILSPSMTGILKRMEELDLVVRTRMTDQRRLQISLTSKSLAIYTQLKLKAFEQYKQIEKKIGKQKLIELYAILDKFIEEI